MKVTRDEFAPITITLESYDDLEAFLWATDYPGDACTSRLEIMQTLNQWLKEVS